MAEENQSFWDKVFSVHHHSDREEKVLEFVIHRLGDGANLEDVVREEYVRRHASPEEDNRYGQGSWRQYLRVLCAPLGDGVLEETIRLPHRAGSHPYAPALPLLVLIHLQATG
jgi:hypothetical protein